MSMWMVGAAIVTGISAIASGDAQRRSLHYQQDVARENAKIASSQANQNEDAQRRMARIELGRQAASASENGGLTGTNLDTYTQSSTNAELDALNIRYQGKLGVISNENQANLRGMEATDANNAGYLNAAAAGLSAYGTYSRPNPTAKGSAS